MHTSQSENPTAIGRLATDQSTDALYRLVHEMCSPLQSVIASNESLSMQNLDDEGREAVARLRRASRMLSMQLDDLAMLVRFQAGDRTLENVSFEVGALMNEAAAQGNHRVEAVAPPEPLFARGDPVLMLQTLERLCRALLHGPETRAVLTLEECHPQTEWLTFCLTCEGLGPLPSGTKDRLALVRILASMLNGYLCVVSDDAGPSQFKLRVPAAFEDAHALAL